MRPRSGRVVVATLAAVAAVATSCGSEAGDSGSTSARVVVGVITEVRGAGSDVDAFMLESRGERMEILVADDVEYGFDLAHLREHQRTEDPVRCRVEEREGGLYALSIDDA